MVVHVHGEAALRGGARRGAGVAIRAERAAALAGEVLGLGALAAGHGVVVVAAALAAEQGLDLRRHGGLEAPGGLRAAREDARDVGHARLAGLVGRNRAVGVRSAESDALEGLRRLAELVWA